MQGASRTSLATAQARLAELVSDADAAVLSEDLFAVTRVLDGEPQLRRTLADSATPGAARADLAKGLLSGKVSDVALRLLAEVVAMRWSHPLDLVDSVEWLAAQASFEQAMKAGTLDEVEDQIFRFARIVDRERELRAALSDRNLPVERKRELLEGLLSGKVDPVSLRIITAAATNPGDRRTLETALASFSELSAKLRERVIAHVTTAVLPDQAQLDRLGATLGRIYGREMDLQVEVDPQLLGGVVVRIGDEVLDGSIANRLTRVRRDLGGSAAAS